MSKHTETRIFVLNKEQYSLNAANRLMAQVMTNKEVVEQKLIYISPDDFFHNLNSSTLDTDNFFFVDFQLIM